jgi:hypothetical protein
MIFRVRRAGGACCDANTRQAFITIAHGIIGIEGHHGGYAGRGRMNRNSLFLAKKKMQNPCFIKKRLVYTIVLARRRTCTDHLVNNATHVQAQTSPRLT